MAVTATTYNGAIPSLPQAINAEIEIFEGQSVLIDLSLQLTLGKIAGVQTIFVDLSKHDGDVFITMLDTLQTICAKAGTQGYYPVLSTSLMKFEVVSNTDGNFPIQFINFPIALGVWGQSGSSARIVENSTWSGIPLACDDTPNKLILNKLIAGEGITISDNCGQIVISATPQSQEELIFSSDIYTISGGSTSNIASDSYITRNVTVNNSELVTTTSSAVSGTNGGTTFTFPKKGVYRIELSDRVYTNGEVTFNENSLPSEFNFGVGLRQITTNTSTSSSANASVYFPNTFEQLFNRNVYNAFIYDSGVEDIYKNKIRYIHGTSFNQAGTTTAINGLSMTGKIKIYRTPIIDIPI